MASWFSSFMLQKEILSFDALFFLILLLQLEAQPLRVLSSCIHRLRSILFRQPDCPFTDSIAFILTVMLPHFIYFLACFFIYVYPSCFALILSSETEESEELTRLYFLVVLEYWITYILFASLPFVVYFVLYNLFTNIHSQNMKP